MTTDPLLVPLQLEAFVLNPKVCGQPGDHGARIAPITQPNYTFLRFDDYVAQNDVQGYADMHNTAPADINSRLTDLGTRQERRNRHGVYVHWTLPRMYRSGVSTTKTVPEERRRKERVGKGLLGGEKTEPNPTPEYPEPPTRWLVVRHLDLATMQPKTDQIKEYEAWVIDSDHLWLLDELDERVDLQVDVSPFILGDRGEDVNVEKQAEVFIGRKVPLEKWTENTDDTKRAGISILRSSNQLFADFQLHNSNVFSFLDNFQYGTDPDNPQYLDVAHASYYIIGWHRTPDVDPLRQQPGTGPRSQRLESLFATLQGNDEWKAAMDSARLLCHGAMYGVKWDREKKPREVPADQFAESLQDPTIPTVSVGTTPLDALITYCTTRRDRRRGEGEVHHEATEADQKVAQLEESILAIQSLLHARDDGVEGQREAKDTVYNWNFARAPGGIHYFLSGDSKDSKEKPIQPDEKGQVLLGRLNQQQLLRDSCHRSCEQLRWDMFSEWWTYITDMKNRDKSSGSMLDKIDDLAKRIDRTTKQLATLESCIKDSLRDPDPQGPLRNVKSGTLPFFYRARDPTVLIGGIDPGWPSDFLGKVSARLPSQAITPSSELPTPFKVVLNATTEVLGKALPEPVVHGLQTLLCEFFALTPIEGDDTTAVPAGKVPPQFHVPLDGDGYSRDQWGDKQPWRPLYMEWEVEYTHIPFEHWSLDELAARLSDNRQIRYGIHTTSGKHLWEELGGPETHDRRILSGRALILPQPSFSLDAKVRQLFADTPETILNGYITPEKRSELREGIRKLPYLSAPLSGLTDGLLTLSQGTHIKPLNKEVGPQGETLTVISSARFSDAGLTGDNLKLIGGNSGLTPYANLVSFPSPVYCPFKPATHGQFRFRRLNIIDKFGQALVAIDPQPRRSARPSLYPCISDFYEPQLLEDVYANTVIQEKPGQCQFVQLPPQINQDARLNAAFVQRTRTPDTDKAYWRPASEWDNPIWGWVVTNYADYGIQFFLPDGTFYCEVRVGGPDGTLSEPKWLPFKPPRGGEATSRTQSDEATDEEGDERTPERIQFDALIDRVRDDHTYLLSFYTMVVNALDSLPPPPASYAEYLTAIVGKPLALVNMGWSLELDRQPLRNQATTATVQDPAIRLPDYHLQVKLGDEEREYDGLVAYFDPSASTDQTNIGHEFNLDTVHSYFAPSPADQPASPVKLITSADYPVFTPFWEDPINDDPAQDPAMPQDPALFEDRRNRHLHVYSAIVDPFTPVHAYSSFLPARSLRLPPWTWQDAMNRMTAFFHAGPLTVTADVADYDAGRQLTTDNVQEVPPHKVSLPALGNGEWNWLQPYVDSENGTVFNSHAIDQKANLQSPGFERGPYTAIEGFLQLRRPIMKEAPRA
ncbi:hypothetical protein BDW42DRAFT_202579 [Aspergillus taichungensis]|uniref:Uncharacterized protein n=1 Tax=Aspergillus taichungensis TaxID=482145 RepID=A0A2J5HK91_9EURO|nr:hypothetical protein BDW42DRAFT_202579 [Aspergillus taichungensis]